MPGHFRCIGPQCGRQYALERPLYRCPACGELLDIEWQTTLPGGGLRQRLAERRASLAALDRSGVWRFRELLPLEPEDWDEVITLEEGNTPLLEAPMAARHAGVERLQIKHLGWNPSGSFKDYGMTVAVTEARRLGCRRVACASTGNTAASMAAYAARAGLEALVFLPRGRIALGKLAQSLDYGARTIEIEGHFDQAMALVEEISGQRQLYLVNSLNPFRLEGQKTIWFELLEQLGWQVPDWIVLPGGNLGNSASLGRALEQLRELGLVDRMPRVAIVQASGADPFARTVQTGSPRLLALPQPETLASAIRIGNPVNWRKAARTLHQTRGCCLSVPDRAIAEAKAVLARDGIGCEPASAASLAGLRQLVREGQVDPEEKIVLILTGHQLKDPQFILDYHRGRLFPREEPSPWVNPPALSAHNLEEIRAILDGLDEAT